MTIYILNGPNLNRLGKREPEIYGTTTLAEIETWCRRAAGDFEIVFRQSNAEAELIDWVHEALDDPKALGMIINPAGLSFYSVPLLDALRMLKLPLIEIHISNIHRRDPPHNHSLISKAATAVIAGLGPKGYPLAVEALKAQLE
jgi:3-dehydroquinate dehydratase-2